MFQGWETCYFQLQCCDHVESLENSITLASRQYVLLYLVQLLSINELAHKVKLVESRFGLQDNHGGCEVHT